MSKPLKTYFNWSSGKDASMAYYHLRNLGHFAIDRLVTSINSHHDRVSMHGLRRELLERQCRAIGLPLTTVELPEEPTMEVYNETMAATVGSLQQAGYTHCGFGDIFLEDLRAYREKQLEPYHIQCEFPLWQRETDAILAEFIQLGFKAVVVCCNAELLGESFVGREIDESFRRDLPDNVDPCGENGEFHTFCYDGPIFSNPVSFAIGEKIYREYQRPSSDESATTDPSMGFWFSDLLPL